MILSTHQEYRSREPPNHFKVTILPEASMTENTIKELHALTCRFDQWLKSHIEEENRRQEDYEEKFDQKIKNFM